MTLKDAFLVYVEKQRNANFIRDANGTDHPNTHQAYAEANEYKRIVLDMIEEIEETEQ
jgi:hypothetical protein